MQELVSKFRLLTLDDSNESPDPPIEPYIPRLIRPDADAIFTEHYHQICHVWTSILLRTSLAPDATCTDVSVRSAFEFLDGVVTGDAHVLVKRLAYLQLTTLLRGVQEIIAIDRQNRRIRPKYGKPNVSVSIDIYLSIQEKGFPRTAILRRVRRAKRWTDLAGPSPLLLLTFSEEAEKIMSFPYPRLIFVTSADANLVEIRRFLTDNSGCLLERYCESTRPLSSKLPHTSTNKGG